MFDVIQLLNRVRAGDPKALDELLEYSRPRIVRRISKRYELPPPIQFDEKI